MENRKKSGLKIRMLISIITAAVLTALSVSSCLAMSAQYNAAADRRSGEIENLEKQLNENHTAVQKISNRAGNQKEQVLSLAPQITQVSQAAANPQSAGKVCYLTFDDGPSDNTLKILKILKKYNAKATFFVTANGKTQYMKNIVDEGHAIALHTYSHDYPTVYSSVDAYFKDLKKISDLVKNQTGVESKIIRFPGGSSNTISKSYCRGIMTVLTKKVQDKGYQYFDWNCDSGDADGNNIPASRLINNVKNTYYNQKNLVILMHDTAAKDTTVDALPSIIEFLKSKGYSFKALTPYSKPCHHGVNN